MEMKNCETNVWSFLKELPTDFTYGVAPATSEQLKVFKKNANRYGVKESVINELTSLYKVANKLDFEVILGFHSCDDEIIFEWWNEGVLWLGQRDFNTLRWVNDKFCLGDAGDYSYSDKNEYDSLEGLVRGCIKEIEDLDNA